MSQPAALSALNGGRQAETFDADQRAQDREATPVVIGGATFSRRRKNWAVSRLMRQIMRVQEKGIALSTRLRLRIAELEVDQAEAASKGETERETELETQIEDLVTKGDEATGDAELVSYRLLALLLKPAPAADGAESTAPAEGWGPDSAGSPEDAGPAIAFLQEHLDVEDAADLARELTGSHEPDPPQTPSSEDGSS